MSWNATIVRRARLTTAALVLFCALIAIGAFPPAGAAVNRTLGKAERFDAVWQALGAEYADPGMRGVNWDAVRRELRPQAEKAKDEAALVDVINKMIARLGDPMTFYLSPADVAKLEKERPPEDRLDIVGVGILLGQTPDGYVLAREVLPKGPAARAGVRAGARITAVDGKAVKGAEVAEVAQSIRGKSGTKVKLQIMAPDGSKREVTLTRAEVRYTAEVKTQVLPGNIGYLYLPGGGDGFESKALAGLRRLHRTQGLILDLRSGWNSADLSHMYPMQKVAALFTDQPFGALVSRQGVALLTPQLTWDNQSERSWWRSLLTPPPTGLDVYKKPMVVLVDETSTWEVLAIGLQEVGRAKVMGRPTSPQQGALAEGLALPDGGGLSVTAMYYVSPRGNTLSAGMKPDTVIPMNQSYLAARYNGSDPDVDAARVFLVNVIRGR